MKRLNKKKIESKTLIEDTSKNNQLNKHIIITIAREYGSGGRYVGRLIADKLGIKFYDKDFIEKLAQQTGLSEEYIEENEQKINTFSNFNNGYYIGLNNSDELFLKETQLIKELANQESSVIIGRCADFILKDREDVLKVFIYSDIKNKTKRATEIYGFDKVKAEKEIKRIDKLRSNHYKHYTEKEWKDYTNYDFCINSDKLGVEKTAELICEMVKEKVLI